MGERPDPGDSITWYVGAGHEVVFLPSAWSPGFYEQNQLSDSHQTAFNFSC
jgi:hypothetical protein